MTTIFLSIFIVVGATYIFYHSNKSEMTLINSNLDNKLYLVRESENKQKVADILSEINSRIIILLRYLQTINNGELSEYIKTLIKKYPETILLENSSIIPDKNYTSFSINKGEQIVFCIQDPSNSKVYDINTLMYVALHEISHIACPDIGHTELFKKIFLYFIQQAIHIGIYNAVNYNINPTPYCGIIIRDNLY